MCSDATLQRHITKREQAPAALRAASTADARPCCKKCRSGHAELGHAGFNHTREAAAARLLRSKARCPGRRAPVAAQRLGDEQRQHALHGPAARIQRVDDGHARAQARPQRPLPQQPRARVRPACGISVRVTRIPGAPKYSWNNHSGCPRVCRVTRSSRWTSLAASNLTETNLSAPDTTAHRPKPPLRGRHPCYQASTANCQGASCAEALINHRNCRDRRVVCTLRQRGDAGHARADPLRQLWRCIAVATKAPARPARSGRRCRSQARCAAARQRPAPRSRHRHCSSPKRARRLLTRPQPAVSQPRARRGKSNPSRRQCGPR